MKKLTLLFLALIASVGVVWGQTNYAASGSIHPATGAPATFWGEGAERTTQTELNGLIDGNTGNLSYIGGYTTRSGEAPYAYSGEMVNSFYIDLGEGTLSYKTILMYWEGAWAKGYKIYGSNDTNNLKANELASQTDTPKTGNNNPQEYILASAVSYRYIYFDFSEVTGVASYNYGIKLYEIKVFQDYTPALTMLTASCNNTALTVGDNATVTVSGKDQIGLPIATGDLTWETTAPAVATVTNGTVSAVGTGSATITAKNGSVVSNGINFTVVAGAKLSIATDAIFPLGDNTLTDSKDKAFDNDANSQWSFSGEVNTEAARDFTYGFIVDLKGTYDLTQIEYTFEGAYSSAFTVYGATADGEFSQLFNGNTQTGSQSLSATNIRYIKFLSTQNATQWGLKLKDFSVYGTEKSTAANATNPTNPTYAVSNQDETSFKVALTSTATNGKFVNYNISYSTGGGAATTLQLSGESGVAMEHTFTGLTEGTTYNFSVTAVDAFGLSSSAVAFDASTSGADTTAPVMNTATLKSVTATTATLTLQGTDETSATVTFTIVDTTNGIDVESTAIASGTEGDYTVTGLNPSTSYTFTVKAKDSAGNVSATGIDVAATTTAIPGAPVPNKFAVNVKSLFSDTYTVVNDVNWQAVWETGSTITDETLSGNPAKKVTVFKGFGITMGAINIASAFGDAGQGHLHFDIYPIAVGTVKVDITKDGFTHSNNVQDISISESDLGKWISKEITLSSFIGEQTFEEITAVLFNGGDGSAAFYIDNIYFYKEVADVALAYGAADANDVVAVTGTLSESKLTTFNAALTGVAYDLTGMDLAEMLTITPSNVNTILIVTEAQKEALGTTKNMVVQNGDQYEGDIEIVDQNNANDFATKLKIYATTAKYTRTIAADKYVTIALPFSAAVPSGFSAYYANDDLSSSSITFNKKNNEMIHEPYIIHNLSDESAEFVATSTEAAVLNFDEATASVNAMKAVFKAKQLTSDSSNIYYVLQNSTDGKVEFLKAGGVWIGAFRGYLYTTSGGAKLSVVFDDGETTKIGTIDANGEIEVGDVYNLAGQRVQNPTKGIYIVNGRKVVIK